MLPIYKIINSYQEPLIGYYYEFQTRILRDIPVNISEYKSYINPATTYLCDYRKYGCNTIEELVEFLNINKIYSSAHIKGSTWELSPQQSNMPDIVNIRQQIKYRHRIFIDYKTNQIRVFSRDLDFIPCTYVKDINDNLIFDRDIVRVANGGLLSSVFGIVFLEQWTLKYKVLIIKTDITRKWSDTVDLNDFKWEVLVNLDQNKVPEALLFENPDIRLDRYQNYLQENSFTLSDKINIIENSEFMPNPCYLCKITDDLNSKSGKDIAFGYAYGDIKTNKTSVLRLQYVIDDLKDHSSDGINNKNDTTDELIEARQSMKSTEDLEHKIRKAAFDFIQRNILPIAREENSDINVHPPICVAKMNKSVESDTTSIDKVVSYTIFNKDTTSDINSIFNSHKNTDKNKIVTFPVYEGDKVRSISNPNIYGYVRYNIEQARFCVEIPEELMERDIIFDGYLPLINDGVYDWELVGNDTILMFEAAMKTFG